MPPSFLNIKIQSQIKTYLLLQMAKRSRSDVSGPTRWLANRLDYWTHEHKHRLL